MKGLLRSLPPSSATLQTFLCGMALGISRHFSWSFDWIRLLWNEWTSIPPNHPKLARKNYISVFFTKVSRHYRTPWIASNLAPESNHGVGRWFFMFWEGNQFNPAISNHVSHASGRGALINKVKALEAFPVPDLRHSHLKCFRACKGWWEQDHMMIRCLHPVTASSLSGTPLQPQSSSATPDAVLGVPDEPRNALRKHLATESQVKLRIEDYSGKGNLLRILKCSGGWYWNPQS